VKKVCKEAQTLIDDENEYQRMVHAVNPFGDGNAAHKIVEHLLKA
jgi:UDP-N-acetylglucosamine 2-epimerase